MKKVALKNSVLTSMIFGAIAISALASAQIVSPPRTEHRDFLDLKAARKDVRRLQKDRRRAVKYGNTSKVAQDDRLIEQDRFWIKRYIHRIKHGG